MTPEMPELCSFTKVKVFFLVLVYVFNFDLFEFFAAILEKGLITWLIVKGSDPTKSKQLWATKSLSCSLKVSDKREVSPFVFGTRLGGRGEEILRNLKKP